MTAPGVGVAVCTYRRPEGLARLLAALPGGEAGADVVIVVDNDGGDPRVAAAVAAARTAGLDVRLTVEPSPGISAARNRAFAEAEAAGVRLLALIDDDEWPAPGWLPALLRRREETGAAVVGGVVRPVFPAGAALAPYARFWSVLPQSRGGRAFVHATSNVLIDLGCLAGVPRPLFDDAYGLTGGGDVVFFAGLFRARRRDGLGRGRGRLRGGAGGARVLGLDRAAAVPGRQPHGSRGGAPRSGASGRR